MTYVKVSSREEHERLATVNDTGGRKHDQVTYKPDGSDWCAVVDAALPGETIIAEADWLALRAENLAATIPAETSQADAIRKQRVAEAASFPVDEYKSYTSDIANKNAAIDAANAAALTADPAADIADPQPRLDTLPKDVWFARRQRELRAQESALRQDVIDIQARIDREAESGVHGVHYDGIAPQALPEILHPDTGAPMTFAEVVSAGLHLPPAPGVVTDFTVDYTYEEDRVREEAETARNTVARVLAVPGITVEQMQEMVDTAVAAQLATKPATDAAPSA